MLTEDDIDRRADLSSHAADAAGTQAPPNATRYFMAALFVAIIVAVLPLD
jgi:hypothetical protein